MRAWRNWQTRMVQVHMGATPWRFESSCPHHKKRLSLEIAFFYGKSNHRVHNRCGVAFCVYIVKKCEKVNTPYRVGFSYFPPYKHLRARGIQILTSFEFVFLLPILRRVIFARSSSNGNMISARFTRSYLVRTRGILHSSLCSELVFLLPFWFFVFSSS